MPDEEILRRIDAHMERGNEHMARGNELMDENRRAFQDLRTFLREMSLRQERVMREMLQSMQEQAEMIREHRREFVQETRAQRAALFRMLDRLDGGESTAGG